MEKRKKRITEARAAFKSIYDSREKAVRKDLGNYFMGIKEAHRLTMKEVAEMIGCTELQTKRLLGKDMKGDLEFKTLVRAADAFNLELKVGVRK